RSRLGVPASVGIAATKFVAKLASGFAKPDGSYLVPKAATVAFLHSLPVGALWGVGEKTRERLERYGLTTVADLAGYPVARLQRIVGTAAGRRLHELAHGRDPRAVEPERIEKSIGAERTFDHDISDRDELRSILLELSHRVAARLRRARCTTATVSLKLRHADFTTITRSRTITPSDVAHDLYTTALGLFEAVEIPPSGVRLLGVRAEQLAHGSHGVQLRLDEADHRREAEAIMDGVRERFGPSALRPASLLQRETRGRHGGESTSRDTSGPPRP
ncbi:MAG TPA: DNA polymerase IV, partial [Actinomycetaceae bacterium]|nr:DNA polymerase IV [Actinomycetaceae bacterium]